ncbi:ATP-dependent DNA ligase [Candidatus Woesearchaeota archaeon]|nr:ATP-dependent DNA ligase [Candidatus Woesearchaeota archaeon]
MDYLKLTDFYEKLEKTSKRLEKTEILSQLLKDLRAEESEAVLNLIQGRVFPNWDERKIGVSDKLVIKAMNIATGISKEEIEKLWVKLGDLGEVSEEITKKKKQTTLRSKKLMVDFVYKTIRELAALEGEGAVNKKTGLIAELLTSAQPQEAKFIVRTLLEDLRVGAGEGTVRDAMVWAFFKEKLKIKYDPVNNQVEMPEGARKEYDFYCEKVQRACDLTNDFAEVFRIIKEEGINGLDRISLKGGKPINMMLFQKARNIAEAFEIVGKPAAFEYKYDGFRLQIHAVKGKILLFTRSLENVTAQFPDVADAVKKYVKGDNYILDAEVIGIDPKTKKWLPFQAISQRIKRKYDIEELAGKIPVMVNVFDIVQYGGKSVLEAPFKDRRKLIEKIVQEVPEKIGPAAEIITSDPAEAEKFYKKALSLGNEGMMAKNLEGIYKPGSRVGYGIKIKPILETLDVVITGAEWGTGKRANWLSSFTISCLTKDKSGFIEVGQVGTGIKEKPEGGVSFEELTKLLKPHVLKHEGKTVQVKPIVIIEVAYEEIQRSTNYNSGFALRFPRLITLRAEKPVKEINTLEDVEKIYLQQRSRHLK